MPDQHGVTLQVCAPRSRAGIAAFGDQDAAMRALEAVSGVAPPVTSVRTYGASIALSCLAPGRWLAEAETGNVLAATLGSRLAGVAAVTDQSGQWHHVLVSGPRAREALGKCVPIDLHARRFQPGDLAVTQAGHLHVRLWHREAGDGFEIAVSSSFATSLHATLRHACLPCGLADYDNAGGVEPFAPRRRS